MELSKNKAKALLVISLFGSIPASQYVASEWGEALKLPVYSSLSNDVAKDVAEEKPSGVAKAQALYENLPVKCDLGDRATFVVGLHKSKPLYALKFEHPSEDETLYLQLKQQKLTEKGYVLGARDYKS